MRASLGLIVVMVACGGSSGGDRADAGGTPGEDAGGAGPDAAEGSDAAPAVLPAVRNGSFEDTTLSADCHSNLTNAELGAAVPHVVGFGASDEVDLYTDDCFGSHSSDGLRHLGLGAQSTTDAVALALSEPVTPGVAYRIRFWGHHGQTGGATSTIVVVGVAHTPAAGDMVGVTGLLPSVPTEQVVDFTAGSAASYITFEVMLDGDLGWAMIDDVRLELAP
jgi:hypothetical protein